MTRVLRYVAAHDVGQAINLQSVEGQIEGAVAMGLGFALSEELVFEEAQNLTTTFAQYLMPTAVEVPDIEPIVLQSGSGMGPFNARGIGEPPIGPTSAGGRRRAPRRHRHQIRPPPDVPGAGRACEGGTR